MNYATLVALLLPFVAKTQAFISAYRVLFAAGLSVVLTLVVLWAFAFRPQALIVVSLLGVLVYAYGRQAVAWVNSRVNP